MTTPTSEEFNGLGTRNESLTTEEILYWAELSCWTVPVLCPFLYWVNGEAVSTDQFVIRTALVVLSLCGAIVLRLTSVLRSRAGRGQNVKKEGLYDD